MMMSFIKITEDIQKAIVQFCIKQQSVNGYTKAEETETLAKSAFLVMNRIPDTRLPVAPIYRYHIYAGAEYTDELFPFSIKENGILYENSIHLGTFMLNSYSAGTKNIVRGYDVIYDLDTKKLRLLYRISTADDYVKTIYRVDTDLYEDFDANEFIIDISSQLIGKLKQSLSYPESMITVKVKEAA